MIYLAASHLRRGNIYLKLGERERAAHHYARFAELWKDCDADLAPLRRAAQAKAEQLRGK